MVLVWNQFPFDHAHAHQPSPSCTHLLVKPHVDDGLLTRTKNIYGVNTFIGYVTVRLLKNILEYSGSISMIWRWVQELLGYQFTVIQSSSKMLGDVDTLSRTHGLLISSHLQIAHVLKSGDEKSRPAAYFSHDFHTFTSTRKKLIDCQPQHIPVLTSEFLSDTTAKPVIVLNPLAQITTQVSLFSAPIILTSVNTSCTNDSHFSINNSEESICSHVSVWLSIDDLIGSHVHGSMIHYCTHPYGNNRWFSARLIRVLAFKCYSLMYQSLRLMSYTRPLPSLIYTLCPFSKSHITVYLMPTLPNGYVRLQISYQLLRIQVRYSHWVLYGIELIIYRCQYGWIAVQHSQTHFQHLGFFQRHYSSSIEHGDANDADILFITIRRNTTIIADKIPDAHTVTFVPSTHDTFVSHTPPPSSISIISISTSAPEIAHNTIDSKTRVIAAIVPSSR